MTLHLKASTSAAPFAKSMDTPLLGQPSLEDTQSLVNTLRKNFYSDKTLDYKWRAQQLGNLEKMLNKGKKQLQAAVSADMQKPEQEFNATEYSKVMDELKFARENLAEWIKPESKSGPLQTFPSRASTQRDSLGVVLIIGGWSSPVLLTLLPLIGAIAGGNCVVIQPGNLALNTSHILKKLIHKYLDFECFRVVEGNTTVTHSLVAQSFDKIFYSGDKTVGRKVAEAAAKNLTPVVLELGGKNPCVFDKSAGKYLNDGVRKLIFSMCQNAGQNSARPDFGLVHEDIADDFFKACRKAMKEFFTKQPENSPNLGRVINEAAFNRLEHLVKAHEPYIAVGGQTDKDDKFIAPTVFDFGSNLKNFASGEFMESEILGPLFPIATYRTNEEAVEFIRNLSTGKPLALYAFGSDSQFIAAMRNRTSAGMMAINDCIPQSSSPNLPFGGVGASGMGSYHGKYSFDSFTHEKAVIQRSPMIENLPYVEKILGTKDSPYSGKKTTVQQLIKSEVAETAFRLMPKQFSSELALGVVLAIITFSGVLDYAALFISAVALSGAPAPITMAQLAAIAIFSSVISVALHLYAGYHAYRIVRRSLF